MKTAIIALSLVLLLLASCAPQKAMPIAPAPTAPQPAAPVTQPVTQPAAPAIGGVAEVDSFEHDLSELDQLEADLKELENI
ncbi:MAG: hypothetical protein QW165_00180 [Candidatus Woesearchaeota archaeon]